MTDLNSLKGKKLYRTLRYVPGLTPEDQLAHLPRTDADREVLRLAAQGGNGSGMNGMGPD